MAGEQNSTRRRYLTSGLLAVLACTLVAGGDARAQTADRPILTYGEVTADDVYLRSGDSMNHYTISKLMAGDRVAIVGERGDWYEILPPEGVFSLISGDYVVTSDDRAGVVSGDNVRVRAGSLLNDNKYTVQAQLSRGAEVQIMGRNPDGFLRIKPPRGATVWVSRQFVEPVPDGSGSGASSVSRPAETSGTTPAEGAGNSTSTVTGPAAPADSPFAGHPMTTQRERLVALDAAAEAEMAKPIHERKLEPLKEQYLALGEQAEDELTRAYAETRARQLGNVITASETLQTMRQLNEKAESSRRAFMEGRAGIPTAVSTIPAGLDAEGELRVSALYPPDSFPRRYRLVDASRPDEPTIAYVELTPGSPLEVDRYIGHRVGVRASSRRLLTGGRNAVPVYTVRELVLLESSTPGSGASAPAGRDSDKSSETVEPEDAPAEPDRAAATDND